MARPLRLEFAGALYHVTARGDGQEDIYLDDADREAFLELLAQARAGGARLSGLGLTHSTYVWLAVLAQLLQ
jgi:hypothetical protein